MLSWEKCLRKNDGIWGKHWYDGTYQTKASQNEKSPKKDKFDVYNKFYEVHPFLLQKNIFFLLNNYI